MVRVQVHPVRPTERADEGRRPRASPMRFARAWADFNRPISRASPADKAKRPSRNRMAAVAVLSQRLRFLRAGEHLRMRSCCRALLVRGSHRTRRAAAVSAGREDSGAAGDPAGLFREIQEGQEDLEGPVDAAAASVVEEVDSVAEDKDLAAGQAVVADRAQGEAG